jgi:hypothetical protein
MLRRALRPFLINAKMAYYRRAIKNKKRFELTVDRPPEGHIQKQSIKSLYRISDGGHAKDRFDFISKEGCLKNFLRVFQPSHDELIIIADNVGDATWDMINALHSNCIRTSLNNAGSWRYAAFDIAMTFPEDQVVYFVEDDYLHLPDSAQVLLEGLSIADYASLYDHKDKYLSANDGGPNPFVESGGELTRVVRTDRVHWKLTNSTTMTFATTVKVLREDQHIWERHTRSRTPNDFSAFLELARKSRRLVTPIPGYSTHCEPAFAAPGIDWRRVAESDM